MKILLTTIEAMVVSISSLIVLSLLIYILFKLLKSQAIAVKKSSMAGLNDIIKYSKFEKYVKYQEKQQVNYLLFGFNVSNFDLLSKELTPGQVTAYLRGIAKNVSLYLPMGSKLAQTKQRDTMFIYVKHEMSMDYELLAANIKYAASMPIPLASHLVIAKNINVGYTYQQENDQYLSLVEKVKKALIYSKRHLGQITCYEDLIKVDIEEYQSQIKRLDNLTVKIEELNIFEKDSSKSLGTMYRPIVDNKESFEFLNNLSSKESAWFNFWMIERIFIHLKYSKAKEYINIPVLTNTLENDNFVEYFETLCNNYLIPTENISITLSGNNIKDENRIIENILTLKGLDVILSYEVTDINEAVYQKIQNYHITQLEIKEFTYKNDSNDLDQLIYFARANRINLITLASNENYQHLFEEHNTTYVASKNNYVYQKNSKRRKAMV